MKEIQFKTFKITRQIRGYIFILIPLKFDIELACWRGIAIGDSSEKYGKIYINVVIHPHHRDFKIL